MSKLGVALAIIGIIVGALLGIFGGVYGLVGTVLGVVGIILGALSLKKGKGKGAIIAGVIAVAISVALMFTGISWANSVKEFAETKGAQYTEATGNESMLAKYTKNTSNGILGIILEMANDPAIANEDQSAIDRFQAELDFYNSLEDGETSSTPAVVPESDTVKEKTPDEAETENQSTENAD